MAMKMCLALPSAHSQMHFSTDCGTNIEGLPTSTPSNFLATRELQVKRLCESEGLKWSLDIVSITVLWHTLWDLAKCPHKAGIEVSFLLLPLSAPPHQNVS